MPQVSVKIQNLAEIRRAFGKAPELMTKNLDKAIKASVLLIERQSKINTPVRTGNLRASHQTMFSPLKGVLEPMANYAIYVHEGTRYMKARPFLKKAVDSENNQVQDQFKTAVQDTLDEIARQTKWVPTQLFSRLQAELNIS